MAASRWTTYVEAAVRADLESVVGWWSRPERWEDQRAFYESLDVSDLRYEETAAPGERTALR